jgi:hypothetical protein
MFLNRILFTLISKALIEDLEAREVTDHKHSLITNARALAQFLTFQYDHAIVQIFYRSRWLCKLSTSKLAFSSIMDIDA